MNSSIQCGYMDDLDDVVGVKEQQAQDRGTMGTTNDVFPLADGRSTVRERTSALSPHLLWRHMALSWTRRE